MGLNKKDIKEFKRIWKEEFGEEISDAYALEQGTKLINLFRVIYRPIPNAKSKKEEKRSNLKISLPKS